MPASGSALVTATSPSDGVRVISFDRPAKRNALSGQLIADFLECLAGASKDPAVKVIVDLCHGMAAVRKPLVAAVNGPALGGGFEVVLMCDLVIAARSSYFALPETQRGLIPGAGGTQRLTAAVGKYRAMRTILLGRPITADEALSWGLLCDVVADGELMERAMGIATELMGRGQEALQFAKEAICRADSLCRDDAYERNLYYATFGTEEKRRGVAGFLTRPTKSSSDATTGEPAGDTTRAA
ncbi:hypothetical protein HIM_03000 [Hirsutella minnesotensis 3608]|nr:hypothetical protein HIM_03000 [Hirsutella minnesotensis 3608]